MAMVFQLGRPRPSPKEQEAGEQKSPQNNHSSQKKQKLANASISNAAADADISLASTSTCSSGSPTRTQLEPKVVAGIASFLDSFYQVCKLREVSKAFNQGILQCSTYCISEKDISAGHHVAALRYVCRVAQGKTILLSPGVYKLEGKYDPYNPGTEDDDILECKYNGDFIKGWSAREIVKWKSNKGSLIIEAEGITLRSSDPTKAASINFCVDDDAEDDPYINWAIVGGKVATFTLEGINTEGGLSVKCRGLTAKRCILGGTVDISGDTSLEDCTIRDGKFGGVASCGNLRMKNCLLDDNEADYISGEGKVGVEVQGGSARFEKTYVLYRSEESAKIDYEKVFYFDPFYDPEKKRWCMQPRNQ